MLMHLSQLFGKAFFGFLSSVLLFGTFLAEQSQASDLPVEFEVIARSGVTQIPGGNGGTFAGFGVAPAIDKQGNVVFTGGGSGQGGIYTANDVCCNVVADYDTPIPGGGGSTFAGFYSTETLDIDNGRVVFKALNEFDELGLYSNVGQSSAADLVEVAVIDGIEWGVGGEPWVDGDTVAMYGQRLNPSMHYTQLIWDGRNGSLDFVDPESGYEVVYNSQASVSEGAAIFARSEGAGYQLVISQGDFHEVLAESDVTLLPGLDGQLVDFFYSHPVVDRGGLDAAFVAKGTGGNRGLYKRVDVGDLEAVADTTMVMPGSGGMIFGQINEAGVALAEGQVVFNGTRQFFEGIYTDIGGGLSVLVDTGINGMIELDGKVEDVISLELGSRSFALTPQGYMVVFGANLASGESVIVRATIPSGPPSTVDQFTVYKDFSDNNGASVSVSLSCSSGTVTNNPQQASESSPAVFSIAGANAGATCTAVENSVPAGYTADESDCQNGDSLNGSCTIYNTNNEKKPDLIFFSGFES